MVEPDALGENARTTMETDGGHRPSVGASVASVLALIGVVAAIGVLDLLSQGQLPSWGTALASWSWALNVLLVILAIVVIVMVMRLVVRGVGAGPHERRARRRARLGGSPYRDPAIEIARARYARGEITQDQLDQTLRQLGKSL